MLTAMPAKKTLVVLECEALGQREFEIDHAERLLAKVNNGGWKLPNGSKFEFVEDGIRLKRNNKDDCGERQEGND